MYLKKGTKLRGGEYVIDEFLAQGGFGITYLATQTGLNRKVALKEFFMKEHCNRDTDTSHVSVPSLGSRDQVARFKAKFVKEAQTIASLNHQNIIRIISVFEENGTAYYVMECIEGGSLNQMSTPDFPMPEELAVKFVRQVANALKYLHSKNILHLDVKPSNILVSDGNAVLIDFGISKRYDVEEGGQTSTTPVGISEGYAPLEQYTKDGIAHFSPATDIYSLGATLYKLVTGKRPMSASELVTLQNGLDIPASVSPRVASAIRAAMCPVIGMRPQNIEDFLGLLDGVKSVPPPIRIPDNGDETCVFEGQQQETPQPSVIPVPQPQAPVVPVPQPPVAPMPVKPVKRSKTWLYVLIAIIVGAVLIGIYSHVNSLEYKTTSFMKSMSDALKQDDEDAALQHLSDYCDWIETLTESEQLEVENVIENFAFENVYEASLLSDFFDSLEYEDDLSVEEEPIVEEDYYDYYDDYDEYDEYDYAGALLDVLDALLN